MSAVCSQCSLAYDTPGPCPRCATSAATTHGGGPRWQQTSWGRLLIGLILAQGLFYGLRHLLTGILLAASGSNPDELWESIAHLLLLQAFQMLALFVGGMMAGGGQHQGLFLGVMVGGWNGMLSVLFRQNPAQELTVVGLYGQPLLHAFFGALGGWVGSLIWKPIPVGVPANLLPQRKKAPRPKVSPFAGKISWFRVFLGTTFAVAGTLSASLLFKKMIDVAAGELATSHEMQDRIITWEIKALAVILGGALAGATATNGFKQGILVGLFATVILIGAQASQTEAVPEMAFWTTISTFSLGMAGGWFGGQLFPPVVKRERLGAAAYT
jgi:hypothetical protein